MNNTTQRQRPLHFSLDTQDQDGEMFVNIPNNKNYQVSNFGRVKSMKTATGKVMLPYQVSALGAFWVRLQGKQIKVRDLVYLSFFGEIKKGLNIRCIDENQENLNVKNLISFDPLELKREPKAPLMLKGTKPYLFNKSQKTQYKEVFKPIAGLVGRYEVSNMGRVRRMKHVHNGINYAVVVLSPSLSGTNRKFRIKIQNEWYVVQDLMLDAFFGLENNQRAFVIDGDPRNLHIDNLDSQKGCARTRSAKPSERSVKITVSSVVQKFKEVTVDLATGNKAEKLLELKGLKKHYYIASSDNGKYLLKLKKA
jgi:hypothetical protein